MYNYLQGHPEIFMSTGKEPSYFARETIPDDHVFNPIRGEKNYLSLFKNAKDEKFLGEASPWYLCDPVAPNLIHQVSPNARILISLRDPVDRLFSDFLLHKRIELKNESFHNEIQMEIRHKEDHNSPHHGVIVIGPFYESVKRYLDIFGNEQVKILIFEDWVKNPKKTVEEVLRFLNVNPSFDFEEKAHNPFRGELATLANYLLESKSISKVAQRVFSKSTRKSLREKALKRTIPKPMMDQKDKDFLINFYQDDVKKLQELLGRELPWLNFKMI